MRILLVAPQSSDTILGAIGGYCKKALKDIGYETEVFDFRKSQYLRSFAGHFVRKYLKKIIPAPSRQIPFVGSLEKEKMNERLLLAAKKSKPDILFVIMGDTISTETLKKIRKTGIATVNWFHDSVVAPIRKDFVREYSGYYDYFFMIDSEDILKHTRVNARVVKTIPLACEPKVHKKIYMNEEEKKYFGSEVSFIGTVKYKREFLLKQLSDFDLGIWGYWLEKVPELRQHYRAQHVFGVDAVKIYNASKIILDIHLSYGSDDDQYNVTPRVFEVPASGALLLVNENRMLRKLYKIGTEIVCYKDEQNLKQLIKHYLSHPEEREQIAKNGQKKAHQSHTYRKRLEQIFSIIKENG
jgi:spore maturation protein CgeB